ncbi:MAG: hypothetical protein P4L50_13200 [Anaerolineaceae bacterium]|nr:hypothetical protein [Anaerolineaceae bacterium]
MPSITNYLTSSAILMAYLGFAGGWGALFRRTRENITWAIFYGIILMLPAAAALPWQLPVKFIVWGISLVITILFAIQPAQMPGWLWHRRFTFGYFGVLMLLILAWTANTGEPVLWAWIGLPACLTAALVWHRAFHFIF